MRLKLLGGFPARKLVQFQHFYSVKVKKVVNRWESTEDPFHPQATEIIDVRSPDEYAQDHIPGAVNLPVLQNMERAEVGKMYSTSPFQARKSGATLVISNIKDILDTHVSKKEQDYKPLVYCWRGGQRSKSLATILSEIGFEVFHLRGGYKTYRNRIREDLEILPAKFRYRVISGLTGSGKTHILTKLSEHGEQVLDLEGLAKHKGSMLGRYPGEEQPSNKYFQTLLREKLSSFDPKKTVWMESESRAIGKCVIPDELFEKMCHAKRICINLPMNERVKHIINEYPQWLEDLEYLHQILDYLTQFYGKNKVEHLKSLSENKQWEEFVECLLLYHYDPSYTLSQKKHQLTDEMVNIDIANLSDMSMETLIPQLKVL